MTKETFTTTIIHAAAGKFLTQVADVDINERIISKKIALGKYDSPDNWKEITDEEVAEIEYEKKYNTNDNNSVTNNNGYFEVD